MDFIVTSTRPSFVLSAIGLLVLSFDAARHFDKLLVRDLAASMFDMTQIEASCSKNGTGCYMPKTS